MTIDETPGRRHRHPRPVGGLLLLGLVAGALVLLGPCLLSSLGTGDGPLRWNPERTVQTPDGEVGLDRGEAKLATTAVALAAPGMAAPDTSGLDEAVLQRLAEGR